MRHAIDAVRQMRQSGPMSDEEEWDDWFARICDFNGTSGGAWSARFEIAGPSLVEQARRELLGIGATLAPNGPYQQYLVTFPAALARELIRIVVANDGTLCERQSATIEGLALPRSKRGGATPGLAATSPLETMPSQHGLVPER
jgi:hypothetical protein